MPRSSRSCSKSPKKSKKPRAARKPLSSSARRSATRKASITRCKTRCEKKGSPDNYAERARLKASRSRKAKEKAANNPWIEYIRYLREDFNNKLAKDEQLSYREILQLAKKMNDPSTKTGDIHGDFRSAVTYDKFKESN